jgi:sister-chromatid-cohesion protein PDS5
MACHLIKQKCKDASWSLAAYEGRISLQSKLYRSLPSGTIQTETMKKNYLPAEYLKELEEEQKSVGEKVKRKGIVYSMERREFIY